jgi:hypothetical protein
MSSRGRHVTAAGLLLVLAAATVPPATAGIECDELWTVGGKGSEEPWLRQNGYRIGMEKAQAQQIRRAGLTGSIARDKWIFNLPTVRMVLVFEEGKLVSATLILEGRDYDAARPDVVEQMGNPADFGMDYVLWKSEECDTVKILKDDGDNVVLLIQSLDYFKRKSVRRK